MAGPTILREDDGTVSVITLNRPEKRNAIDVATMRLLGEVVQGVIDDPAQRVMVITGAGDVAFSAGGDMREMLEHSPLSSDQVMVAWQDTQRVIERSVKPLIAAVNGYAYGGGTEIAMACHIRVAAETAKFGQTEIAHDHIPGGGGTQRLPRLLPLGVAYEHLLTGDPISAQDAWRLGFVNHVWPADELMPNALALARRIAERSKVAVGYTMEAVRDGLQGPLDAGLRLERALASLVSESKDHDTGIERFFAGRGGATERDEP